jgi:hypothetical protein
MYVNALLNSIEKRRLFRGCNLTVYLMHHDFPMEYFEEAQKAFSFRLLPIEIKRNDIDHPPATKRIEFVKRARFHYMPLYSKGYDAVCLLDGDMYMVSEEFMKLFDMVAHTDYLIGCNERFKWSIGDNYQFEGKPIFATPQKLYQMHCSVPIIFDMERWGHVFECYNRIAFHGTQEKNGNTTGIGDIYCWNISVQNCGKQSDVVVFPIETMCQVHRTNMKDWTYMQEEGGYWFTFAGDRVYSIQGRIAQPNFVDGSIEWYREDAKNGGRAVNEKQVDKIRKGLQAIQREWWDLNFNQKVNLYNYQPKNDFWDSLRPA